MEDESQNLQTLEPEPSSGRFSSPDLSAEIVGAVERQVGDRVRCRRVSNSMYRCNWMTLDRSADSALIETWRIRQSRFLRVVKVNGQLVIEDLTAN